MDQVTMTGKPSTAASPLGSWVLLVLFMYRVVKCCIVVKFWELYILLRTLHWESCNHKVILADYSVLLLTTLTWSTQTSISTEYAADCRSQWVSHLEGTLIIFCRQVKLQKRLCWLALPKVGNNNLEYVGYVLRWSIQIYL